MPLSRSRQGFYQTFLKCKAGEYTAGTEDWDLDCSHPISSQCHLPHWGSFQPRLKILDPTSFQFWFREALFDGIVSAIVVQSEMLMQESLNSPRERSGVAIPSLNFLIIRNRSFVIMALFPHHFLRWFFLILFWQLPNVTASGCYYAYNSTILHSPDFVDPCGTSPSSSNPYLNCCALQANNKCLSAGLCYDPNQIGGTYYISPCTDQTYRAPECPQYCSMSISNTNTSSNHVRKAQS